MRIHVYHEHVGTRIVQAISARAPARAVTLCATREALADALGEVEVLFAGIPPRWSWAGASRARLIQLMGAGADVLLPAEELPAEVRIAGMRGVMAPEVAEHAIALLLALLRALPTVVERQRERRWRQFASARLDGSTLCVVGVGSIGQRVARVGEAFGMRVLGVRRSGAPLPHVAEMFEPASLHEALVQADHVVVTVPLTGATRGLLDADALAALPAGAHLVQVGRGGVIDEAALLGALRSGHLGGAALDVFTHEPLPEDSPLWDAPNFLVSPHLAGVGLDYIDRSVEALLDNVGRLERGEPLRGEIDREQGY